MASTTRAQSRGLHRAAKLEDAFHARLEDRLSERGWRPQITAYTGYGAPGWVRVMGRVLLSRPEPRTSRPDELRRGWHQFVTVPAVGVGVRVRAGDAETVVTTDRGGYLDLRMECELPAGWQEVELEVVGPDAGGEVESVDEPTDDRPEQTPEGGVRAPVLVIGPDTDIGLVSDIDDTVMVTSLPRAMLAAWNTFVLERARAASPSRAWRCSTSGW